MSPSGGIIRARRYQWLGSAAVSATIHLGVLVLLSGMVFTCAGLTDRPLLFLPAVTSEGIEVLATVELPYPIAGSAPLLQANHCDLLPAASQTIHSPFLPFGDSTADGVTGSGFGSVKPRLIRPFGIDIRAERIVFIVDGSRSMEIDNRSGSAYDEILTAVRRMNLGQLFGVILFGDEVRPDVFRKELVGPLPEEYAEFSKWLRRHKSTDFTFLAPAARYALTLQPDVIVLVTDGKYCDARPVHDVWRTASKDVIIHTVNIGSNDGEALLRSTAEHHNGTYLYVETKRASDASLVSTPGTSPF
ncbi:MAG: VWA domain-containing protein [Planctomycetales bacterium]|nr:VWA domain-containing protein [Planctomycetales bacterium]MCA9142634.1 VWA domain-containing protein [Planctomycetales bacterium]